MTCRFNRNAKCSNPHGVCECCTIPNLYGWFSAHKKMKWTWTQRFILPLERKERLAYQEIVIARARAEIVKIKEIPAK